MRMQLRYTCPHRHAGHTTLFERFLVHLMLTYREMISGMATYVARTDIAPGIHLSNERLGDFRKDSSVHEAPNWAMRAFRVYPVRPHASSPSSGPLSPDSGALRGIVHNLTGAT